MNNSDVKRNHGTMHDHCQVNQQEINPAVQRKRGDMGIHLVWSATNFYGFREHDNQVVTNQGQDVFMGTPPFSAVGTYILNDSMFTNIIV